MWLLYVTFEDFICLSYPAKSAAVLSTRVDINHYFNTGPFSAKRRKSKKRHRDSPDKATEETCEENRHKHNLGDEHLNQNELGLRIGEVICVHQIARKRRLGRSVSDNTSSDNSENCVHGVNDLNSIRLDNIDMPYRDRDRMHERRKKDQRSNVTLTKDYGFGNSWRTRQSGDIIRNCHLTDQLVNHNGSEQSPRNKNLPDNRVCQRDNPALKITNGCLNRTADHCVGFSPLNAYPQEEIHNNHLNLSCSATNTPLSLNLTNDLDRRNNILNVSAFNPGDSKSARFRLKLDLNTRNKPKSPRRICSKEELSGATGNSDLTRSASFDNVITPDKEMPSKALSCESSPVTISSGYESDSLPTNEADIDNIFVQGKKKQSNRPVPPMELPIDYFSMSDSHPSPHGQPICTSAIVTRKPETFVQNELNEQSQQNKSITEETGPPVQTHQERTDNQTPTRFSPAQINNYQLTKVARSMFEIIHDLQAERDQENKMKSRKLKRHVQWRKDRPDVLRKPVRNIENESGVNTSVSQQENCEQSRENFQPAPLSSQGKVSVRCLRRPLGSDPSFQNRQFLPHSSEFDKTLEFPAEFCRFNNSASYPEFSRQLSEPEIRSRDIHSEKFQMNHSFDSRDKRHQIVFEGCAPYATTKLPGCSPYATTRLPGCHTPRRDDKDDHVYETIPGDDLLQYEEILRMRLNGLLPHKYHPPALPARNINDRKMSEPLRTDFNANFRLQQHNIQSNPHFQQNLQNDINIISTSSNHRNHQISKPRSFSYDPSDPSKTVPNELLSRWSAADLLNYIDGIRQPPPKRRENFYFLLDSKQKRACFSESLEIENKIKDMGINLDESRRSHQDEDGYTTVDNEPSEAPPFCGGLHNMQSTYV
ncbi:uncharacterized protein LOC127711147 [Mytilus californianus]|uniref:uncharacterized protein LOC127711147 n=1 Tax=Mytilus californianus TaxID=6549 RepID=UPI002247D416|nr:uncharacterized protein LOC127711147 [Mytilus californianus]